MKLLVGLGNPGDRYQHTRHNLGFIIVDQFLKDFELMKETVWQNDSKLKSDVVTLEWKPKHGDLEKIILVKPKTYMNNSGMAVSLIASFYKVSPDNIWIVHDEIDLPVGSMKIRFGGAAAGHHGVESIIASLGTDKFWRFRMGIGATHHHTTAKDGDGKQHTMSKERLRHVDDFVLNTFAHGEMGKIRELIKRGSKSLRLGLESGLEAAMNRYNTK